MSCSSIAVVVTRGVAAAVASVEFRSIPRVQGEAHRDVAGSLRNFLVIRQRVISS